MDASPDAYAYRCVPLNIANGHGWELLNPAAFTATWDGTGGADGVRVTSDADPDMIPISHFGGGILTFDLQIVFRTSPRWNLWVTGPVNEPHDGIAPLSALIETDWLPYPFTMNWIFTRPHQAVEFMRGDPICHFFPVPRGYLEEIRPELRSIDDDPELKAGLHGWGRSRDQHAQAVAKAPWQKHYHKGAGPGGPSAPSDHRTTLRLQRFTLGRASSPIA
jgi:hypothetical protein